MGTLVNPCMALTYQLPIDILMDTALSIDTDVSSTSALQMCESEFFAIVPVYWARNGSGSGSDGHCLGLSVLLNGRR
jgi:hypothetical protein